MVLVVLTGTAMLRRGGGSGDGGSRQSLEGMCYYCCQTEQEEEEAREEGEAKVLLLPTDHETTGFDKGYMSLEFLRSVLGLLPTCLWPDGCKRVMLVVMVAEAPVFICSLCVYV